MEKCNYSVLGINELYNYAFVISDERYFEQGATYLEFHY